MRGSPPRYTVVFLVAGQLACAAGSTTVSSERFPTAASDCRLPNVRVGEKITLSMKDGHTAGGRFIRVECVPEPTLFLVNPSDEGDPWDRPDTQAVAFSAIREIRLGEPESAKTVYAVVIGFIGLIVLLNLAHVGGGSWFPST